MSNRESRQWMRWTPMLLLLAGCAVKLDGSDPHAASSDTDRSSEAGRTVDIKGGSGNEGSRPTSATGRQGNGGLERRGADPGSNGIDCSMGTAANEPDFDEDGYADACDRDDDGDGFDDDIDPDPFDPLVPGDYSTPEAILGDPLIQTVLQAAEEAGHPLTTSLATAPPNVAGYYREAIGSATYKASGDGTSVGERSAGGEYRWETTGLLFSAAATFFSEAGPLGNYVHSTNQLLRGEGDGFTIYSRFKVVCTASGKAYATYRIGVWSGRVEPDTGDLVENLSASVTVAAEEGSAACTNIAGNAEIVGGWNVRAVPRMVRSSPESMQYMCVDEQAAYVPEETWVRANGETCSCSGGLAVKCEP